MRKHYNTSEAWNTIQDLPEGEYKEQQKRLLSHLVRGNLHWFARKLIGGTSYNDKAWIDDKISKGEMLPQSDFRRYMKRLYEDNFS